MTTTVITPVSHSFPDAAHDPVSTASGTHGVVTFINRMRAISAPLPRMTSTTLAGSTQLPAWIHVVLDEVRRFDRDALLSAETINRLLLAISILPNSIPKPEVGVGDDGTVGLEWDIDATGIEIHLGNDPAEDVFILSDDEGIIEVPLFLTLPKIAKKLGRVLSSS